jgi:hypothetical protein
VNRIQRSRGYGAAVLGLLLSLAAIGVSAEGFRSPMNGRAIAPPTGDGYRFAALGHVRGRRNSVYPAASFVLHLDRITQGSAFLVLLGDIYNEPNEELIERFDEAVLARVSVPVFNAVGNHDVKDRIVQAVVDDTTFAYGQHYGPTWYRFTHGTEMFVVLDTELDGHGIEGDQLAMLAAALREARDSPTIRNVFILSHKLIWSFTNPEYRFLAEMGHSAFDAADFYFARTVEPLLIDVARTRPVYWISGDTGAFPGSPNIIYAKSREHDITYLAAGIGDLQQDAFLEISVDRDSRVALAAVSMTGSPVMPVQSYDIAYWNERRYSAEAERRLRETPPRPSDKPLQIRLVRIINSRSHLYAAVTSGVFMGLLGAWLGSRAETRRKPRRKE